MTDAHRPDIDGLRALAVTSVVLYHAGWTAIPAGFAGVDVFFVISGYLITAQLWNARHQPLGALLLDFYARRVRRILPALTVVVMATLALGALLLVPSGEQQDLARSAIAAALFVSNEHFRPESGNYFDGPAELQPLLHTWSLAVEEQFYLFWPLLLAAFWTLARRWTRWSAETAVLFGVAFTSLLSLALSIALTAIKPSAAFFLMPSRLWELGGGAVVAMVLARTGAARLPSFAGAAGLAGIVAALVLFSSGTRFPGVAALLPVAGTALVIAAGAQGRAGPAYRLLSSRPMTFTGRISYAWYLWHWPLLAFARVLDMGRHNLVRDSALALLAYLLAFLSTHFLETPIREKRIAFFSTTRASLLAGTGLLLLTTLLSLALWTSARTQFRSELAPASLSCMQESGGTKLEGDGPCVLAQGRRAAIFLVGDSHANHWSPAIASWAGTAGARAIERSFAGCPVPWVSRHSIKEVRDAGDTDGCSAFSRLAMAEIEQTAASGAPTGVIVSASWQDYTGDSITAQPILAGNFDEALAAFERAGVRVLVIGPTPRFAHAIPACIARLDERECRISRDQHEAATRAATAMLNAVVAEHPHVGLWDPASHYCDARHCYPSRSGAPMFRDKELLSRRGAQTAVPDLAPVLDQLLPARPRADR